MHFKNCWSCSRRPVWREPVRECEVCGKEMLARNINRHMLIHNNSRKFQCQECSFFCFDIIDLKRHYRGRHKLSSPSIKKLMKFITREPQPYVKSLVERRSSFASFSEGIRRSSDDFEGMRRSSIDNSSIGQSSFMTRRSSSTASSENTPPPEPPLPVIKTRSLRGAGTGTESDDAASELSESSSESTNNQVDQVIRNMPYLKPGQMERQEKGFNPVQRKHLKDVFDLTWHPTHNQKQIMVEKLGIPLNNLRYWFDNNRRKLLRQQEREKSKPLAVLEPRQKRQRPNDKIEKLTYNREDLHKSRTSLEETIESGEAVCIGVDLAADIKRCLLCTFECNVRKTLIKHLQSHRFKSRFCGKEAGEEASRLKGGCRKIFSEDTFDVHTCTLDPPKYFSFKAPLERRSSAVSESGSEGGKAELRALLAELTAAGGPVCIGYDLNDISHCNMCKFSCTSRGNLFRHFMHHGGVEYKFCSAKRVGGRDGCRKIFTPDTFDLHNCADELPGPLGCFPLNGRGLKRFDERLTSTEEDEEEDEKEEESEEEEVKEEDANEEIEQTELDLAAEMTAAGKAVCVGYEINENLSQCTLCNYSCPVRGNMYKHLGSHGMRSIRFCKEAREKSELPEDTKGCRKIFTKETYDRHVCTEDGPEQLGEFTIYRGAATNRRSPQKVKELKKARVPDGSPAKFYCDGYTKLFHRLGSRDKHAFPMDSTFHRNGQLELVYLTAGQLKAVREFCNGNDKYYLVGLLHTRFYTVI